MIADRFAALERQYGGRLGVAVLNTGTGKRVSHRGDERFPLCSTHKLLTVACVLSRVDRGQESLSRRITFPKSALVPYSPITGRHTGGAAGMTVAEICAAALTVSDNTAANLLLASFGGPAAWTAYARSLGDRITRLDRREPELNEGRPGDPRDTTSPDAMLEDLRKIVLGHALTRRSRAQLVEWIVACRTGEKRLRAGIPAGWRAGDKTGSGDNNAANDIAVIWPPHGAPRIVTAYYIGSRATSEERDHVLAEVGRLATQS